jgi:hypothetical protein
MVNSFARREPCALQARRLGNLPAPGWRATLRWLPSAELPVRHRCGAYVPVPGGRMSSQADRWLLTLVQRPEGQFGRLADDMLSTCPFGGGPHPMAHLRSRARTRGQNRAQGGSETPRCASGPERPCSIPNALARHWDDNREQMNSSTFSQATPLGGEGKALGAMGREHRTLEGRRYGPQDLSNPNPTLINYGRQARV